MSALAVPGECLDAYLANTVDGRPMREIARLERCEASTILRRVRRVEDLRDHPEWEAILSALEVARNRLQTAPKGGLTRETILTALGLTAEKVSAAFPPVAQVLMRPGGEILAGDVPMVAACADGETHATLRREIMLAALAFGWIAPSGKTDGKVRRFVATEAILECATPGNVRAPGKTGPLSGTPRSRYSPPECPVATLLRRKGQSLITVEHLALAREFREIYALRETAMAVAFTDIQTGLPPRVLALLQEVCGEDTGLEAAERKLGLPSRSAKAVLAYALDTFGHLKARAA